MAVVLPLGLALGAAATFGLSTSLQHLSSRGRGGTSTVGLMASLVRTRLWLTGMGLSVVAFVAHAVAISAGPLVVVQPVIVTGVVFAVLIRAGLDGRWPTRAETGWATLTGAGLAAFLIGVGSPAHAAGPPRHAGEAVVGLLVVAALVAVRARRCPTGSVGKAMWLGVLSGVLFGLMAGLLKLVVLDPYAGLPALVSDWPVWLILACGSCAVLVNQRAYQTERLSVSMPILNIVDVLVALLLAGVIFGELPSRSPAALTAEALGLAAMGLGVAGLAALEDRQQRAAPRPDDGSPGGPDLAPALTPAVPGDRP